MIVLDVCQLLYVHYKSISIVFQNPNIFIIRTLLLQLILSFIHTNQRQLQKKYVISINNS